MSRPIVLSNGSLHVGINRNGYVHDFYYPHVGQENHSAGEGTRHRIGVWADGVTTWLDDSTWQLSFETAEQALIGSVSARNEHIGVSIDFTVFVASDIDAYIRTAQVTNLRNEAREVRLFLHQAFVIGDSRSNHDTAQYLPDSSAILHYHGDRAFVISALHNTKPFDQHSIGLFGIEGREGTFRDAEDGELDGAVVEHGRVDSTLRHTLHLPPRESQRVQYWIACGTTTRDALAVHKHVQDHGIQKIADSTSMWWKTWLTPTLSVAASIDNHDRRKQFIKSAMVLRSHIDNDGAVIASTDTTMLNYARDAYGYCWPRDGAHVLWPLVRLGYTKEADKFFAFCRSALHPSGYLMHKYQADGSLGPSWHPYAHGETQAPPIQEDETALTLYMFSVWIDTSAAEHKLEEFYDSFVKPMADFLSNYIDETTGLPKPTYDLWEERFATFTYTVGTVYGALCAASRLAERMKDMSAAVSWKSAADDVRSMSHKYLFNSDRSAFYKSISILDRKIEYDDTLDISSLYGAVTFGLFDADSDEAIAAYQTIKRTFEVTKDNPVLPRYEHDDYHRTESSGFGNPWYIASLWLAQYALELSDADFAETVLSWIEQRLDNTGMLSEQFDRDTSAAISVSPLAWSHAEYMTTVLDTMKGKNL